MHTYSHDETSFFEPSGILANEDLIHFSPNQPLPFKTTLNLADSEESSSNSTDFHKGTDNQEVEAPTTLQSLAVDEGIRTLCEQTTSLNLQNLTASTEDSSNCTSLDLSSGPSSPVVTSSTINYFVGLFKPSIENLDKVITTYLTNQSRLKALLEEISRGMSS